MFRITSKAMAVLLRLVMVLSLAGYSFSSVNAAMHPASHAEITQIETDHAGHHGDDHLTKNVDHHVDQHDDQSAEKSKTSCCKDYCGVAAITCSGSALSHPNLASVLEYIDDTDTVGQEPSLHRPPNI